MADSYGISISSTVAKAVGLQAGKQEANVSKWEKNDDANRETMKEDNTPKIFLIIRLWFLLLYLLLYVDPDRFSRWCWNRLCRSSHRRLLLFASRYISHPGKVTNHKNATCIIIIVVEFPFLVSFLAFTCRRSFVPRSATNRSPSHVQCAIATRWPYIYSWRVQEYRTEKSKTAFQKWPPEKPVAHTNGQRHLGSAILGVL